MRNKCPNCKSEVNAEIKNIMLDKMRLERPCWHCVSCNMSFPTKEEDKYEWADRFQWADSFIYGLDFDKDYCMGCEVSGTMYADTNLVMGGDYFPFHTELHPTFCCYTCGFTVKCLEKDRNKWVELYHLWA